MTNESIASGVKTLRAELGDSLQKFATRFDMSIASAVRYEQGTRRPGLELLVHFANVAEENQFHASATIFNNAVIHELGEVALTAVVSVGSQVRDALDLLTGDDTGSENVVRAIEKLKSALTALQRVNPFRSPMAEESTE